MNHACIAALGITVAGCSLLTDTSDLTFAEAASTSVSSAGGSTATSTTSSGGTANGGAGGLGGCIPTHPGGSAKRVFVTSATYQGDLASLDAGTDTHLGTAAECQRLAEEACMRGAWKAWLSVASYGPVDGYFARSELPYETMNGDLVASDWSDLVDGLLEHPIDRDEHNQPVSGLVWTATNPGGTAVGVQCDLAGPWTATSSGAQGSVGNSGAVGTEWANFMLTGCHNSLQLYCFEQ